MAAETGVIEHPPKMSPGSADTEDNASTPEVVIQLLQHFGGVNIHIHNSLGINEEKGNLRPGRVDQLTYPAGKIGRIEKEERPGKAIDQ